MPSGFVIRKNQYYDSVFLMSVNKHLSDEKGVQQTAVLMGSDGNKKLLAEIGFENAQIVAAQANDLVVAVVADTDSIVKDVLGKLDQFFQGAGEGVTVSDIHTLEDGLKAKPNANLAVISVPGEFAAREALVALKKGLHVFLFSDNVSIDDELQLKKLAHEKGLLVMGPDCGTSILNGVGIGFANSVRRGSIGVIGPSGTGLQEFTVQVHNAGYGISHAIGTGSHDLSDKIEGLTTFSALDALEEDPQTKVIAIISKPPGGKTLSRLIERFKTSIKPVVACFLGVDKALEGEGELFQRCETIDQAVNCALRVLDPREKFSGNDHSRLKKSIVQEKKGRAPQQRFLRGIFAGGTFCYQSQQILKAAGISIYSNAPLEKKLQLNHPGHSQENTIVDMGDDYFMQGRPHPMINGLERKKRILQESEDPEMAILLLDFILGYNSSMDPVGEVLDAIIESKKRAHERHGYLGVVASLCGTESDLQDVKMQTQMLKDAGVIVFNSNAQATYFCKELLL
jgi:succinyl-CoA synthetase alpha subunit